MPGKVLGIAAVLLLSSIRNSTAQTPTGGPSPTPTPPPPVYLSDPAVVNTDTTNNQKRPAVAVGTDGRYLIVWHSDAAQLGFFDIKGQLFTKDGAKVGNEFQIDQAGTNRVQYTPDIAADGLGNYIVVWADFDQTVTDAEIWMRRYDGGASPLGAALQVNQFTTGRQRVPQVAANSAGDFVVVWESDGQDGNGFGVFGRQFSASAAPQGGEFPVNTLPTGDQTRPVVHMDDEGFTVAFNDGASGVAAREFAGGPLANQFTALPPNHRNADVARFDGTSRTLYVAENTSTGSIDGAVSAAGVIGSPFVIIPGSEGTLANARVEAYSSPAPAPLSWTGGETPAGGPSDHGVVLSERFHEDIGWIALAQLLVAEDGFAEVGAPFRISEGNLEQSVPRGGVRRDQAVATTQYIGHAPAASPRGESDGDGYAVHQVRFGAPDATHGFAPNETGAFEESSAATFGTSPTNLGLDPLPLTGTLSAIPAVGTGPNAPSSVTITDASADYGTIPVLGTGDCEAEGDCYGITITGPRPAVHWDEAVVESLSTNVQKTFLLHVGESFADVPTTNLFYAFIENLLHNGVTAGGACGGYCPTDGVKRQQMAVFLLKSLFGPSVVPPPATGTIFTDVTLANPFASWIEALFLLGITGGCSGGPPPAPTQFCPDAIVNRQQMAVFLLKTLLGSTYVPPAATGIFQDVPDTNPFRPWIEDLYNRQVTGGCVPVPLQYCPANPTNRQQMAAFLVKTFGLLLYGP